MGAANVDGPPDPREAPAGEDRADELQRRRTEARHGKARRRRISLAVGLAVLAGIGAVVAARMTNGGSGRVATSVVAPRTRPPHRSRPALHRPAANVAAAPAAPVAVPILVYHVIAPPFANSPYPGLYVPPAEFTAQMVALHRAGFHAVTMDQVLRSWRTRTALPKRPVVVSFDNGYRTQYTVALPVLRRLGWVGVENLQLSGLPPSQGGLSPEQVRGLVAAGWELDTQGWNHADLPTFVRSGRGARGSLRRSWPP